MKTPLYVGLVLVGLAASALARLGEGPQELQARYGKPVEIDSTARIARFEKEGVEIRVYMGPTQRAEWITYQREGGFTMEERKELLAANAEGETWVDTTPAPSYTSTALGRKTGIIPPSRWSYEASTRRAVYLTHEEYFGVTLKGLTITPPEPRKNLGGF